MARILVGSGGIETGMSKLFISHSSQDDDFVRELRQALGDLEQDVWVDSRELRGGDPLWSDIQKAIEDASAYAVVVSTDALQSKWVGKELRHALEVQKERGRGKFPVIPLSLNETKLGVLEEFFGEEPTYVPVSSDPGGIDGAMNAILAALGKRLCADVAHTPQPKDEPLEELVLELTDLRFHEEDGARRASACARLVYDSATPGQREVASEQSWRFVAPIGPIEAEELRWYLEKYAVWPSYHYRDRARKVQESLVEWGRLLHGAAMPAEHTANVMNAWARIDGRAGRRFSVYVDMKRTLEAGASAADMATAREVSALLLGLPWELLHDGDGFLFQGAEPMCVRRRLPNTRVLGVPVVATPIRVLLVTARPEDDSCLFVDHRVVALPVIEAMEDLGDRVRITMLDQPTLPALREELGRARHAGEPYHVLHFDGYGSFDDRVGLGALCFEDPRDTGLLERRRHVSVTTEELRPLFRHYRTPLVFLGALPSAAVSRTSGCIAAQLLELGSVSVATMSHSVLVETLRLFAGAFYRELAQGRRVGDGMLRGQRTLKDNASRGRIFGAGELRIEDWFVPALFQEKEDPRLFRTAPPLQTREGLKAALEARLGELPAAPATGFVGQSRQLLALERLLRQQRYAVIRGQAGEGKTALAAELARWMVRSHQIRRAAFVSVETHSSLPAVLDVIGRQIVPSYSVATFEDMEQACLPVERALVEQSTLLVVDNMESILLPPYLETPEALSEDARRELGTILDLCKRLNAKGDTRIVFTSREPLPPPFDGELHRRELHQLDREDAVKLVERVLNQEDAEAGAAAEAGREAIEQLVDAVHCHARTLALLAPPLRSTGAEATRASLVELMAEMDRRFPGSREQSVFASVELSLRRMSPANQENARVLGVFHGGVDLNVLVWMMEWEEAEVRSLAGELVETGLATPTRYGHLSLNPALCPYLRGQLDEGEREPLTARWGEAMAAYVRYLVQQRDESTEIAATLTVLELPNLFALLERVEAAGDGEATIDLATSLYSLLQWLGKPHLLDRVAQTRDGAAAELGETWSQARFQAQATRVDQQLTGRRLREAFDGARQLLQRARAEGQNAYPDADCDLASACFLLARVLRTAGRSGEALPLLDEAWQRFEAVVNDRGNRPAERMAGTCFAERGDCLLALGRLDEAAAAYEEGIRRAENLSGEREVAVGKGQLGTVRMAQRRYPEALEAYQQARERFTQLEEPGTVAVSWHQTGMVYQKAGQPHAAEDAYRESLAISVRLGDVAGQARTLNQLGLLYDDTLNRTEEAVTFLRQAADKHAENRDVVNEGGSRTNLAIRLRKLRRLDEARQEIRRAIECKAQFGHASEPWHTWSVLADIETDAGNSAAAAEAKQKAIECYLAYRRDGGENHDAPGRICLAVTQTLLAGDPAAATSFLQQRAADPEAAWLHPFIQALQTIVAGSRDRALAAAPEFHPTMAAEILFLIETLEKAQ